MYRDGRKWFRLIWFKVTQMFKLDPTWKQTVEIHYHHHHYYYNYFFLSFLPRRLKGKESTRRLGSSALRESYLPLWSWKWTKWRVVVGTLNSCKSSGNNSRCWEFTRTPALLAERNMVLPGREGSSWSKCCLSTYRYCSEKVCVPILGTTAT